MKDRKLRWTGLVSETFENYWIVFLKLQRNWTVILSCFCFRYFQSCMFMPYVKFLKLMMQELFVLTASGINKWHFSYMVVSFILWVFFDGIMKNVSITSRFQINKEEVIEIRHVYLGMPICQIVWVGISFLQNHSLARTDCESVHPLISEMASQYMLQMRLCESAAEVGVVFLQSLVCWVAYHVLT